jgi:hypothetical protein
MKRLLLLFPFYILFLSAVPCSASDRCCMEEMGAKAPERQPAGGKDQRPEFPCSPFFACGANHGMVIPDGRLEMIRLDPPVVKLHFFYSERPLFAFIPSVWQPPRAA